MSDNERLIESAKLIQAELADDKNVSLGPLYELLDRFITRLTPDPVKDLYNLTFEGANSWDRLSPPSKESLRNFYKGARTPRKFQRWSDIPADTKRVLNKYGQIARTGGADPGEHFAPYTEMIGIE